MRRFAPALALLAGLLAALAPAAAFSPPPVPARFVHDGAGLLSPQERSALEEKVLALDRRQGLQIGIAILPSLEGEAVESATLAIAESWKPGHAGKDDGVILAVFTADRKLRIEVGYGLEGAIPDAISSRIIRGILVPAMRDGQPARGIEAAVDALAAAARGETQALPPRRSRRDLTLGLTSLVVLFGLLALFSFMARRLHGSRVYSRGGVSQFPWWLPTTTGPTSRRRDWPGGGWSGGGWSGGGGGFGGGSFGGGSFGGGGASGGW